MESPELDKTIMPHLGRVFKMTGIYMAEKFAQVQIDLTREQFILLLKLHQKDGQTQNDLAFITERNKASLTRLINTLENKNLVARIPSKEDKRVNRIYLTKKGRKIFKTTTPTITEMINEVQNGLTKKEIETTIKVMHKVLNNIKKLH